GEEDVAPAFEDVLRPVAVVHVPVEDHHPLGPQPPAGLRGDGDVVEQAKAHRARCLRVVPGRTAEHEGVGGAPVPDLLDGADRRAGDSGWPGPGSWLRNRVSVAISVGSAGGVGGVGMEEIYTGPRVVRSRGAAGAAPPGRSKRKLAPPSVAAATTISAPWSRT